MIPSSGGTVPTSSTGGVLPTSSVGVPKENPINTVAPQANPANSMASSAPSLSPDHLTAVANAAPKLSPAETVAVASSSSSYQDAAVRASVVHAVNTGAKLSDLFQQLSPAQQTRLWATIPSTFKSLMISANYRPPGNVPEAASGGFWHDVVHTLDNSRHLVSTIGNVAKQGLVYAPSKVFNDALKPVTSLAEGAIYNAKQAGIQSYEQGNSFDSLGAIAHSLDPVSILRAYNSVYSGKVSFAPESVMYVQKELGVTGSKFQLAQAFARGASLQQVLTSLPESARAKAATYFSQNEDFKKAVSILSDSGLSLGQVLFGGLNPNQMKQLFPRYSRGYFQANQAAGGALGAAGTVGMIASGNEEGAAATFADGMTLRGASALGGAGAQLAGTGAGLLSGKTADAATQIQPYGKKINPLSGLTDALVNWYANPLQRGIQFSHIARDVEKAQVLLNAMGDGKNVEYLYNNSPNYVRWAKNFGKALTTPEEGSAIAETPNIAQARKMGFATDGMQEEIVKYWPEIKAGAEAGTPNTGIARMMADNQSLINLLRGRAANSFRDTASLPYLTLRNDLIDHVLGVGKSALQGSRFNVGKMGLTKSLAAVGAQTEIDQARLLQEADPSSKLGLPARWGRRLTNQVPTGPVDMNAPDSVTQVERLARALALPEKQVEKFVNQYSLLDATETGEKRKLFMSLVREGLANLGIDHTPAGAKWLQDWEQRQNYAGYGNDMVVDPMNPEGPKIPAALYPSQTSSFTGIPDWAEVYRFSRKSTLMKLFNLGLNNRGMDVFMSKFWKRAMLFRPAFGIRFGGEEALNFVLRNGVTKYLQSRLAANVTGAADASRDSVLTSVGNTILGTEKPSLQLWAQQQAEAKGLIELGDAALSGKPAAVNELDAHILAHALFGEVPTELLRVALEGDAAKLGTKELAKLQAALKPEVAFEDISHGGANEVHLRLMAVANATRAIGWLQRAEMKIAGEQMMAASYELARRGVLGSTYADEIDAISARGNVYTGDKGKAAQNPHELIKDANGEPIQIVANGGFEKVTPDDPEVYPKFYHGLGQLAADPLARAAAKGLTTGGYDQQIQNVEDAIYRRDLLEKIDSATKDIEDAASKKETNPTTLARMTKARDTLQHGYDEHIRSMQSVVHYNQTADGVTVKSGLVTQEDAIRQWAQRIVDDVNNTLTTMHPQEVDKNGEPIVPEAPQPIRLRPGRVPRTPFEVMIGNEKYRLSDEQGHGPYGNPKTPYRAIPKDSVRLFKGINPDAVIKTGGVYENPARTWFFSYADAMDHAGAGGTVYNVDVPLSSARENLVTRATNGQAPEEFLSEMSRQQHAGSVAPGQGHIETGDLHFGKTTEPILNLLPDLIGQGIVPGVRELRNIPHEALPDEFIAPRLFSKASRSKGGALNDFAEKGMEVMVGKPANYISRHPIFQANYARAWQQAKEGLAARGIADADGSLAHDIAMERAANDTVPFIHDPSQKSQFSVITRNLMPFWFAQEQFYKRWARLFGAYPEAWYKLSLAVGGLNHTGFVYTDQYGKQAFIYPGSEAFNNLLNKAFGMGGPGNVGFSTELNQLNPTTALGGVPFPSFSPVVSIPLSFAAVMFPGMVPIAQGLRGPDAPSLQTQGDWFNQVWQQITPSVVNRAYTWASTPSGQGGTQDISAPIVMSAMNSAMKLLEMSGHSPTTAQLKGPESATIQQQFLDRIANWTKNIIGLRAVFGFFSPGTPNLAFNDNGLGQEFQTYLQTMPYQQALQTFFTLHPNARPEDVFTSTTDGSPSMPGGGSGAYIPSTTQAVDYINANMGLFTKYPGLAPWTIPANAAKGIFSGTAYQEEKNLNLRSPRTLQDMYQQMKYAEGATIYYPTETLFKAAEGDANSQQQLGLSATEAMQQLGMPTNYGPTQVKEIWSKWSQDFQKTHPVFANQIAAHGIEAQVRRTAIMNQLQDAVNAGDLPENPWTKAIGPLMQGYLEVKQYADATKGNTAYSSERMQNYNSFLAWGTQYVKMNPEVAQFWNGVMMASVPK